VRGSPGTSPLGVVGLGVMGGRAARALAAAGTPVLVHDLSPRLVEAARADGLEVAASLQDLADRCEVVVLSLPGPPAVLAVARDLAAAARGTTVLDTSTVDPATARAAAELLAASGGDWADCPVLGRPGSVGSWTVPVGGSEAAAAVAAAVLEPVTRAVVRVGGVGTAATIKVLNNLMLSAINAVTAEALLLAEAAGLDPGTFVDVVVDSGAASVSPLFRDVAARAVDGDFSPTFPVRLMHKDNHLAVTLADQLGVPLLVGGAAHALNTMAMASGHADEDSIAVLRALEDLTGRRARRDPAAAAAGSAEG